MHNPTPPHSPEAEQATLAFISSLSLIWLAPF